MFTFSGFVDALLKARGHKYIKRIPYMSGGRRRYRYIYKVTHTHRGRQAFDADHLDVGTAFALHTEAGAEFHGHITKVRGDQVTYRIDDGERKGESVTVSKSELLSQLNDVHGIESKLSAERDKLRSQIEVAREKGSEKQVKRLEERLARLGGEEKRAEPEPEPESESEDKPLLEQIIDRPLARRLEGGRGLDVNVWLGSNREGDMILDIPKAQENLERSLKDYMLNGRVFENLERANQRGDLKLIPERERVKKISFIMSMVANRVISRIQSEGGRERYPADLREILLDEIKTHLLERSADPVSERSDATTLSEEQIDALETLVGGMGLSVFERDKLKGSNVAKKISYQSALDYAQGYSARGVTAKEILRFVSPMPARQDRVVYELGGHGSLAINKNGLKISYQYQFPDGTVSDVMSLSMVSGNKKKLNADDRRDIPRALASAFFAGRADGKEAYRRIGRAMEVQQELMIHKRAQRVADGVELLKQLDAVHQEGYRQTNTETPIVESGVAPASVSGDATDLTDKQRKNLERYNDRSRYRSGLNEITQDGRYIAAGDGTRLVYHVTENNVRNAVLSGGRLFEGQGRPFARFIPNNAPSVTLDRASIRKIRDALKLVSDVHVPPSELAKVGDVYEVRIANRVLARIPAHEGDNMRDGDAVALQANYLRDALKSAGKSATLRMKDKASPIQVDAESGVNHLIMPLRR